MPRPQFTLRALVAMLVVGAFLGGIPLERKRLDRDRQAIRQEAFWEKERLYYELLRSRTKDNQALQNENAILRHQLAEAEEKTIRAMRSKTKMLQDETRRRRATTEKSRTQE